MEVGGRINGLLLLRNREDFAFLSSHSFFFFFFDLGKKSQKASERKYIPSANLACCSFPFPFLFKISLLK